VNGPLGAGKPPSFVIAADPSLVGFATCRRPMNGILA